MRLAVIIFLLVFSSVSCASTSSTNANTNVALEISSKLSECGRQAVSEWSDSWSFHLEIGESEIRAGATSTDGSGFTLVLPKAEDKKPVMQVAATKASLDGTLTMARSFLACVKGVE